MASPLPPEAPARPGLLRALHRVGCAALLAVGASCAGPGTERNLAPLISSHSAADGAHEIEALGGLALTRRDPVSGERTYWAVRPIVSNRYEPNDDRFAWFLPPLGFVKDDASLDATVAQFLPLARYQRTPEANGFMSWSLLVLPGIYWASHSDGRIQRAFFPFFGLVEKFLSWDRATFALFPLWIRIERFGRTTDYVLWPFFSVSRGTGGFGWRVWPLVGHNSWEGRYSRWFAAWPFLHFQQNDLQYPEDQQQRSWFLWPLVGQSRRGPAHQTTVLWPFFGHTDDPETGFWATDAPWFLVRFQGGDPDRAVRKRVWPFYSYYEGDGLTSRWYAWPFIRQRREEYPDGTKEGLNVFPFWRSSTRVRKPLVVGDVEVEREERPGTERFRKIWPLGKVRTGVDQEDVHLVDLNPFQELDFVDEHYAWLWEVYGRQQRGEVVRSRSWLGLWRREKDADEDRRSLSGLWGARDYTRAGRRTRERSWLFGLLRYRTTEGGGFSLLRPAFPGPGWPMRRVPSSTPEGTFER